MFAQRLSRLHRCVSYTGGCRRSLALSAQLRPSDVARRLLLPQATVFPRESTRAPRRAQKGTCMLWTIFVILLIMWLLGMVSGYAFGGFIHILLIVAIVVVLIRVIQGRTPV